MTTINVYVSKTKFTFEDPEKYELDRELGLLIIKGTERNSKVEGEFRFTISNITYHIVVGGDIEPKVNKIESKSTTKSTKKTTASE